MKWQHHTAAPADSPTAPDGTLIDPLESSSAVAVRDNFISAGCRLRPEGSRLRRDRAYVRRRVPRQPSATSSAADASDTQIDEGRPMIWAFVERPCARGPAL